MQRSFSKDTFMEILANTVIFGGAKWANGSPYLT